ncbi:hypothetical protein JOC85_004140 [Bacillus mesophilus]|uniref:Uncharacterized protein n=1 Tax=Bacillus mesophilus TaxID=1808955 RepID=A0A6M0QCG7_9BACI|nr:hypothetical protein [Bacillus mesophilus]MBM7663268.1 hypothetical protein [Bacillus mesophilus]NEY74053.1 hypothetical protein [Bacillus mesophilus]
MVGYFIAGVIIVFFILIGSSLFSTGKKTPLKKHPIPDQLGIQIEAGFPILQRLDSSLSQYYLDNIKLRVMQNHPKWKDHEFEWGMFELKRYFVMNSLLKSVPMFSHRADEIWHEMLMFTRDYEKFSKGFYHDLLHHTPNMDSTPIPGERAFFDWVFISLFEITENSRAIWGCFFQNPIKRQILDDFKVLSEDELLTKYFRINDDWLEVKKLLINKLKDEISEADQAKLTSEKISKSRAAGDSHINTYVAGAAVFYSLYEEDDFQGNMSEVTPEEYQKGSPYSGGSYCSGFACSGDSGGGGDSGSSSCGGGCSS